jgi:type II restriction enzyme
MSLNCKPELGAHLHGRTQQVRVITECWFQGFGYCLACLSDVLEPTRPNSKARDFICPNCEAPYELKSSAKHLGTRIVDGEFAAMMGRIAAGEAPTLMMLQYTSTWRIHNLLALHSVFLTPVIVEARKPLSPTARRAGWQGCNLRLDRIPTDGKICLIQNGAVREKGEVRKLFAQSVRLAELKPAKRGWTALALNAVRKIGKPEFSLNDIYAFEDEMHAAYPQNSHVRDKIRQQMQVLRDMGYVEFLGHGEYRVLI